MIPQQIIERGTRGKNACLAMDRDQDSGMERKESVTSWDGERQQVM